MIRPIRMLLSISLVALGTSDTVAQKMPFTVINPSELPRVSEPAVAPWSGFAAVFDRIDLKKLRLIDDAGRSLAFQVDDTDGDGTLDELAFLASVGPRGERRYELTIESDSVASPVGPPRTDARNYKRIDGKKTSIDDDKGPGTLRADNLYPFDGVGWESTVIAYRLYLDERNAMDIQGKRERSLVWDFIGRTGTNYQLDAYWGMDVLHVGPAFGFGGFGIMAGGTVVKPDVVRERRTRIIARGPVRSIVRVEYTGWKAGDRSIDLSSTLTIYANDRITEHRITSSSEIQIATGIVKHPAARLTERIPEGYIYTMGNQSRANDGLFMMLSFDTATGVKKLETDVDHGVVIPAGPGNAARVFMSAIWEGENGRAIGQDVIENETKRVTERMSLPLRVQVK